MSSHEISEQKKQDAQVEKEKSEKKCDWKKPAILSIEPLEAAATICEPANAPFGKDFPGTCGTLGS